MTRRRGAGRPSARAIARAVVSLVLLTAVMSLPLLAQSPQPPATGQQRAAPAETEQQTGGLFGRQSPRPVQPPGIDMTTAFLKMIVALLVVLALVVGLAWLLRRVSSRLQRAGGGVVSVLAQVPLGNTQFLSVVDIGGEIIVLGVTEHSVTALTEIEDASVIEQLRSEGAGGKRAGGSLTRLPSFRQWLSKAQQGELDG